MTLAEQPGFLGSERQLKILQRALEEENIQIWNSFNASNGPGFKANLKGINLSGLALREIDFTRAYLEGADFQGSDLRFAKLDYADLQNTRFQEADLRGACLDHAILKGASFENANLSRAKLGTVDLDEADMGGAVLLGARIRAGKPGKTAISHVKNLGKVTILTQRRDAPHSSPWIKAKEEEEQRKKQRLEKEKIQKVEEKKKRYRHYGIKKELRPWDKD